MNSLVAFFDANLEALTTGMLVLCLGTVGLGALVLLMMSLDKGFEAADGNRALGDWQ